MQKLKMSTDAKTLLLNHLANYTGANSALTKLARRLAEETDTSLIDWVDHICLADHHTLSKELKEHGFQTTGSDPHFDHFTYPGLPHVLVYDADHFHLRGVAIRADSIADYLMVRGISSAIEGAPLGSFRQVAVATEQGVALWAVERRGPFSLKPSPRQSGGPERVMRAREACRSRPRVWEDHAAALKQAENRIDQMIELVGKPLAADLFLEAERDYWQSRCAPAMLQKMKQDTLGLGWANRKGHTFYSSQDLLPSFTALLESLGFAQQEDSWVHPEIGETVYIQSGKAAAKWCALHGDSILRGGLYSLTIPLLKEPERTEAVWPVEGERLDALLEQGVLTEDEAATIREEGAPGSCLETRIPKK